MPALLSGGSSGVAPPVPIPNTEVKRPSADDTALVTEWENRSPPESTKNSFDPRVAGVMAREKSAGDPKPLQRKD